MALTNSPAIYGGVTKTFHWLTALLIFTAFPLGIIAHGLPFSTDAEVAEKVWFFSLHKTVGVTTFFVAVLRILWAYSQPKPGLLNADHVVEATAAEVAHWLLYISMVLVPLSGWILHASQAGGAPILLPIGQGLPLIPQSEALAEIAGKWHFLFKNILAITIILHVAGAIKHVVIDKDSTLKRMLPVKMDAPALPKQSHSKLPAVIAVAVYAGAITMGLLTGTNETDHDHATLDEVQSDWVVSEGTLALTVQQLGSAVSGNFTDWTANISFDPNTAGLQKGSVDVTVAIDSLSLGSVTDQAMGADFFDAATFPTAQFTADILDVGSAEYEAQGTLTLKGAIVPVSFPFTLEIQDGVATMSGTTQVARLDFKIGESMQDESSLGFAVDIAIDLTATNSQ